VIYAGYTEVKPNLAIGHQGSNKSWHPHIAFS